MLFGLGTGLGIGLGILLGLRMAKRPEPFSPAADKLAVKLLWLRRYSPDVEVFFAERELMQRTRGMSGG